MNLFLLNKKRVSSIICIGLLLFAACVSDNEEELFAEREAILAAQGCNPDNEEISYINCIVPILESNCSITGCHDSNSAAFGVVLETYDETKIYVDNGQLVLLINSDDPTKVMPKFGKMDQLKIDLIENWIAQGALNN